MRIYVCVRIRWRACVSACVRACVHVCLCVCAPEGIIDVPILDPQYYGNLI